MNLCERCGATAQPMHMSYFNTDVLCGECDAEERAHPQFEEARRAEIKQCKKGNFNFPGIGLPADLAAKVRSRLDGQQVDAAFRRILAGGA